MMKTYYLSLTFLFLTAISVLAQTPGELTISTSSSETGGNYAPRNIVAIWIEDDAGNFQKTLLAYAQTRKTHLNTWQAATSEAGSEYNVIDAITGATRPSHDTRTCYWDGTNFNGFELADGEYFVWMELTDKNGTGNFSSFPFTKGEDLYFSMPSNVPSFSSISITWKPDETTSISEPLNENSITVYPNPGNGQFTVKGLEVVEIEIRSFDGKLLLKTNKKQVNISDQPEGIYLVVVKTFNGSKTVKLFKK